MKSSGRNGTMINIETIRKLNNYDVDKLIGVLELNEDRLYAWLVLDSPSVVRDDLDRSIESVNALRKVVRSERLDYVSPYEAVLPI
jgi:hypothetical protein